MTTMSPRYFRIAVVLLLLASIALAALLAAPELSRQPRSGADAQMLTTSGGRDGTAAWLAATGPPRPSSWAVAMASATGSSRFSRSLG